MVRQKPGGSAIPSSPSVDALAAVAARKAAKLEKSLNKVPAMQRIADEIRNERVRDQQGVDQVAVVERLVDNRNEQLEDDSESDKDVEMTVCSISDESDN